MRMKFKKVAQMEFFKTEIEDIKIDTNSRDDIPQILRGLQHIFTTIELRDAVLQILEDELLPPTTKTDVGRPGMSSWQTFVFGMLRLNLNSDWDRIKELADQHRCVRQMLGLGDLEWDTKFGLQTIKDNVSLLRVETIVKINSLVAGAGHSLFNGKGGGESEPIHARVDSFVLETDVKYPTDINLLFDAMRKVIQLSFALTSMIGHGGWRKWKANLRNVRSRFNHCRKKSWRKSMSEAEKDRLAEVYLAYLDVCEQFIERSRRMIGELCHEQLDSKVRRIHDELVSFLSHAERQVDQVRRRGVLGETIPHCEKVFSVFEEHTEWISKGKAGVPQELGLRVCVLTDQHGFTLRHIVMRGETDDKVAVRIVEEALGKFPQIQSCSFDKGFWSPENDRRLKEIIPMPVIPKKGKLSQDRLKWERSEEFRLHARTHPAVESAINALEKHGLDRCLDKGLTGFERYTAIAILARNIQIIGAKLIDAENKKIKRGRKIREGIREAKLSKVA